MSFLQLLVKRFSRASVSAAVFRSSARLSHLDNFQDVYQKLRRKSADGVMDHGDIAQKVYEYSHKRAEQEREEKQRKAMETKKPNKSAK